MNMDTSTVKNMLNANAEIFRRATGGIPDEEWLRQPDGSNHMLWVAGHIVIHRAKMAEMLGAEWSAPWSGLFARGAKLASPEDYPSPEEIRRAWDEVSQEANSALANATPEALSQHSDKSSFDGTVGGGVALLCFHETYHVGQLGYLRKWLGHGQSVG
jgi:uncharacterized damage-inducible protein DinB